MLDVGIALLVAVTVGGYSQGWLDPHSILPLLVALGAVLLLAGWVVCLVLIHRLRDNPIPGFANGLPNTLIGTLRDVAAQGALLALIAAATTALAAPWVALLSAATLVALGQMRFAQIAAHLWGVP